jgi:hypothetical protein
VIQQQGFLCARAVSQRRGALHSSAPHQPATPVSPCKGGRTNWKTCKKTGKMGILPKINRAEQRKTGYPRPNRAITASSPSLAILSWAYRSHNCQPRAERPCRMFFFLPRTALFTTKKPGAASARASCTALDYGSLYTNRVTQCLLTSSCKAFASKTLPDRSRD